MSEGMTHGLPPPLNVITKLLVDVVLVQQLNRFYDTLVALRTAGQEGDRKRYSATAARLCKKSREIRFQLGPPEHSPEQAVRGIVALLTLASNEIKFDPEDPQEGDLALYSANIRERSRLILERFAEHSKG